MVERILKFFLDLKKPEYRRLYFIVFRYLNITKTFLINFKSLPFSQAIKLPIWVYGSASFISTRGSINIDCPKIIPGMIHLGFPEDIYFNPKENGLINNNGSIDENQLTKLVTDIYKKSHNINELDNLDLNIIKNSVVKLPIINDDIRDGNMQIYESVKNSKVKGITNSP